MSIEVRTASLEDCISVVEQGKTLGIINEIDGNLVEAVNTIYEEAEALGFDTESGSRTKRKMFTGLARFAGSKAFSDLSEFAHLRVIEGDDGFPVAVE